MNDPHLSGGRALPPATFVPLHCSPDQIAIHIEPGDPPPPTPGMLERWAAATEANPRLFNGPILRYRSHAVARQPGPGPSPSCLITATRDTYQRYAMQRHDPAAASPDEDIYHLAVTGVVMSTNPAGVERVLIGRRGDGVFVYPGMWELAPGGGLESEDILAQLWQEMAEELGLDVLATDRRKIIEPAGPGDVLGLSFDPNTPSVDVVVRVRLRRDAAIPRAGVSDHAWEYGATRWIPVGDIPALQEREGANIIPPTVAIWRGLGWLDPA